MTAPADGKSPIEVLLVEDDPGDVLMTQEAFEEHKLRNRLTVVSDGAEALAYLRREGQYADAVAPDLILLDLNLPRRDGREVLEEIKKDEELRRIPVVVLTTSAGRRGHPAQLPAARQRLRDQAGRLRAVHLGGPADRRVLRQRGEAAAAWLTPCSTTSASCCGEAADAGRAAAVPAARRAPTSPRRRPARWSPSPTGGPRS